MSAVWFIILFLAWGNGIKIDDMSYMMIAIFYVGDCILMQNRRLNDGEIITLEEVDRIPTAYDPDKVVEQLEELRKECEDQLQDYDPTYFIDKAIEIVKGGEVNELFN